MNLYYVHDKDNSYRLVVYASHRWSARYKATEWMRKNYNVDISVHNWETDICDNSIVIGMSEVFGEAFSVFEE